MKRQLCRGFNAGMAFTIFLASAIAQGTRTERDLLGEKKIPADAY
jgi:hypothetical protein